jgi:hypothetical protein
MGSVAARRNHLVIRINSHKLHFCGTAMEKHAITFKMSSPEQNAGWKAGEAPPGWARPRR